MSDLTIAYEMVYEMPIDLYGDWKDLYFAKELSKNIVQALKDHRKKGE